MLVTLSGCTLAWRPRRVVGSIEQFIYSHAGLEEPVTSGGGGDNAVPRSRSTGACSPLWLAPPLDELVSPSYVDDAANGGKGMWRNLFENPTTVQFDHRVMAMTTYLATALLFASSRRVAVRAALPLAALHAVAAAFAMVNVQAALCISTLLYLVPVPLAATHQAGSVVLLSAVSWRSAGPVPLPGRGGRRIWRERRQEKPRLLRDSNRSIIL